MVSPSINVGRPMRLGQLFQSNDGLLLLPIPLGALISIFSLIVGAHVDYVIMQFIIFLFIPPLLFIMRYDDRYSASIILISFMKVFYISQIVSVFYTSAPDANLSAPMMTLVGIAAGLAASIAGIGVARLIVSALPRGRPILRMEITPARLRRLGYFSAAIGLTAQVVWTFLLSRLGGDERGGLGQVGSGLVVFGYLSNFEMLSLACFVAAELIVTNGRTFLSRPFFAVLALYLIATAPQGSKAPALVPLVLVFAIALQFRWKIKLAPIVGAALVFVFVSEFLSPVITYSRMISFSEHQSSPVVFAEELGAAIVDPTRLGYDKSFSQVLERGNIRLYYGKSAGLLDRFTPERTDTLVSSSAYVQPAGPKIFVDALTSILPQSLGFKRDVTGAARRDEAALFRQSDVMGKVSWENTGFIGDGFVAGGLIMAVVFMFLLGLLSSLAARATFGAATPSVFWAAFLPGCMLIVADQTFVGAVPIYFWTWVFLTVGIFGVLRWMARRDSGLMGA